MWERKGCFRLRGVSFPVPICSVTLPRRQEKKEDQSQVLLHQSQALLHRRYLFPCQKICSLRLDFGARRVVGSGDINTRRHFRLSSFVPFAWGERAFGRDFLESQ